ncbi:hypothetical protein IE53DRAFT_371461 [Violaceomyces palustris]|uniref:Uncharacterized protein n=1 Tax=Violaceomyces palustris TaxID=1673888 RepID=A0ACD0NNP2_9BASI|nr:hypothetical protein IE53DRAFT_371461 [Violaceomyces palustris]
MATNANPQLGGSRQHPHLPPHLAPLAPLEPSAERQHAYNLAQSAGRRGSTDPLLHASIAASASGSANGLSHHHHGHSHSLSSHSHPLSHSEFPGHSSMSSTSGPFDAPRRRSIQFDPTVPLNHTSPFPSPSHAGIASGRFHGHANLASSAALSNGTRQGEDGTTLPPLAPPITSIDPPSDRPGQIQSNYQFGSYSSNHGSGNSFLKSEEASKISSLPRIPTVSAPDGDGGNILERREQALTNISESLTASRRGSSTGISSGGAGATLGVPEKKETPYSRSPELRVSHKLAERKRRKEMKELFDDLRDQLPVDRGPKTSKWEILSKAVEHINQLNAEKADLARELEALRSELGPSYRPGLNGAATSGNSLSAPPKSQHGEYGASSDYQPSQKAQNQQEGSYSHSGHGEGQVGGGMVMGYQEVNQTHSQLNGR